MVTKNKKAWVDVLRRCLKMITMTAGEMLGFMDRLNEIVEANLTEAFKNERLANLMTDLERAYQIPGLLANATNVDPIALQFYQAVSAEREFLMVKSRLAVIEDVVKFLKENRQGSVPLNIIDAEYLIQQAHRAEHNAQDLDILDRELAKTQKKVERYHEVFQEIKENKITCWEVIENKLNFAFYKE